MRHTRWLAGVATMLAMTIVAGSALAAPGDLDPSFGTDGTVSTRFAPVRGQAYTIAAIALQPDGHIVALGTDAADHFVLTRYSASGALDFGFGDDGVVLTQFFDRPPFPVQPYALALQSDGKIVAAGQAGSGDISFQIGLARYNPDGSLDTGFGVAGKVVTRFDDAVGFALAVQPDGKILAAGGTNTPFVQDFALVRYMPDGSLDSTFGSGGKVQTDFGGSDGVTSLALEPDGKIVAVGHSSHFEPGVPASVVLARYKPDGRLDASFGDAGKVNASGLNPVDLGRVIRQTDGKLVVLGAKDGNPALARYNSDGSLDASFGSGGVAAVAFSMRPASLAKQSDGSLVLVGTLRNETGENFAVARLTADGSPDATFGSGGMVTTHFGGGRTFAAARDAAVQPDGNIIVAGGWGACGSDGSPSCFALARYLAASASPDDASSD